ncbi:amino acid ABC transporter permease [Intrasporangium calvum]|uniref:Amino acid ABC transporter membrane protein 2, PAAT family n=1 Tax=Intrasporangium calvum (strain ATCC 23552 / DSM 43043 / JCM 3097 / NBRC 12989 / NCIMB 10167 / NRRL B-3866 / 7 KIP) TaxID=710696 RepID=E6SD33_INTC7|nr:amino acid ABC transporter permease [Intrasporangium calvum]ADU48621.1 amino acid ABC transporter membrane protein 2, PAAT family [Intrasporangium calvum DSM 43043]
MSTAVLFDAPGPRARARHRVLSLVGLLLILSFVGFALWKLGEKGNLDAEKWTPFLTGEIWVEYLIPGLLTTLKAAVISVALAGIFGVAFGMGRVSNHAAVRWLSTIVVEFFRSVPVLVMMIAAFYYYSANNVFDSDINPLAAVITGLTLYNGSVVAELIRSGAGLSIGLTPGQTLRSILLPQAITAMLPSLVSQLVVVLKDTALGAIITYDELLNKFGQIGSYKGNPVPAMIVIAIIFIVINYALTRVAAYVERRLRERGRVTITRGAAGPGAVAEVDTAILDEQLQEADERALRDR